MFNITVDGENLIIRQVRPKYYVSMKKFFCKSSFIAFKFLCTISYIKSAYLIKLFGNRPYAHDVTERKVRPRRRQTLKVWWTLPGDFTQVSVLITEDVGSFVVSVSVVAIVVIVCGIVVDVVIMGVVLLGLEYAPFPILSRITFYWCKNKEVNHG